MIDDENFDWAFCGFQLQTKLFLDGREDRKLGRLACRGVNRF